MARTPTLPRDLIEIVIRSGRTKFETYQEFEAELLALLGCELDYLRRLLNGTRPIRQKHKSAIASLIGFEIDFSVSKRDLAVQLGLSSSEAGHFLDRPGYGLDFTSRTTDRRSIENLFNLMHGYWEGAYRSFSRTDQHAITRELFIVDGINQDNFITCRSRDVLCTNTGVIFPVLSQLYIMYEKDMVFDEVVVHLTNRPDRSPPLLRGITLGLSGGVDEIHTVPSASRVTFRYLGKTPDEIKRYYPDAPQSPDALEDYLAEQVVEYIDEAGLAALSPELAAHLQILFLDNTVSSDSTPFVLRAYP